MNNKTQGFTIVEILVTLFIIGVAAGSITSLFISIQSLQRQAGYSDMATRAAQREIEVLRNDNYTVLTAGQTIDFSAQLPTALPGPRSGTVSVSQPALDLRRVDVTVSYKSGGGIKKVVLSSLIGVIGITQ